MHVCVWQCKLIEKILNLVLKYAICASHLKCLYRVKRKLTTKECQKRAAVIQAAVKAVRNAAKEFNAPYSTLHEHCTGKHVINISLGLQGRQAKLVLEALLF